MTRSELRVLVAAAIADGAGLAASGVLYRDDAESYRAREFRRALALADELLSVAAEDEHAEVDARRVGRLLPEERQREGRQ